MENIRRPGPQNQLIKSHVNLHGLIQNAQGLHGSTQGYIYYGFQFTVSTRFLSTRRSGTPNLVPFLGVLFLYWIVFSNFCVIVWFYLLIFCSICLNNNEWRKENIATNISEQLKYHIYLLGERKSIFSNHFWEGLIFRSSWSM